MFFHGCSNIPKIYINTKDLIKRAEMIGGG
jgi:hypothetical protein